MRRRVASAPGRGALPARAEVGEEGGRAGGRAGCPRRPGAPVGWRAGGRTGAEAWPKPEARRPVQPSREASEPAWAPCWPLRTVPKKGRGCLPLGFVCPWSVYFSVLFVRCPWQSFWE